eukprot:m.10974 g.10974  ORF g.10974 m.10974 type:complete len:301 (+) comp7194_c0_seq1:1880-2782(+)
MGNVNVGQGMPRLCGHLAEVQDQNNRDRGHAENGKKGCLAQTLELQRRQHQQNHHRLRPHRASAATRRPDHVRQILRRDVLDHDTIRPELSKLDVLHNLLTAVPVRRQPEVPERMRTAVERDRGRLEHDGESDPGEDLEASKEKNDDKAKDPAETGHCLWHPQHCHPHDDCRDHGPSCLPRHARSIVRERVKPALCLEQLLCAVFYVCILIATLFGVVVVVVHANHRHMWQCVGTCGCGVFSGAKLSIFVCAERCLSDVWPSLLVLHRTTCTTRWVGSDRDEFCWDARDLVHAHTQCMGR